MALTTTSRDTYSKQRMKQVIHIKHDSNYVYNLKELTKKLNMHIIYQFKGF